MAQKRMGRPKLAAKHKRTVRVVSLLTPDEYAQLAAAAKHADVPFADFVRDVLLKAAAGDAS
jgi:hypothetical protein